MKSEIELLSYVLELKSHCNHRHKIKKYVKRMLFSTVIDVFLITSSPTHNKIPVQKSPGVLAKLPQ